MPLNKANLLELDVEKLFEERSIDYIIEIERLIDEEIERKRSELRLMVGYVFQINFFIYWIILIVQGSI